MKRCYICKNTLPLDVFYKDARNMTDGRQAGCKPCLRTKSEAKRRANGVSAQRYNDPNATHKKCSRCAEVKAIGHYPVDTRTTDGRGSECLVCKQVESRNRNRRRGMVERIPQSVHDTEKRCRTCKIVKQISDFYEVSHKRNADGHMAHCKSCWAVKSDETRRKLAHYYTEYANHRRAGFRKASPSWLTKEHRKEMVKFYELSKKMAKLTGQRYEVDHIIPLKGKLVCGLHVPWNLQVIPMTKNRQKSNKVLDAT
jgi:hypothetical protein